MGNLWSLFLSMQRFQKRPTFIRQSWPWRRPKRNLTKGCISIGLCWVFDKENKVVGGLSQWDVLRALEPKYKEMMGPQKNYPVPDLAPSS